jgi:addiction module HigA family antidote
LRQCIEPLGLSIIHAAALRVTRNTLSELVNGKRGISGILPEKAVRLSKVFGGTEEGWLVQQAQYELAQVPRNRIEPETAGSGLKVLATSLARVGAVYEDVHIGVYWCCTV